MFSLCETAQARLAGHWSFDEIGTPAAVDSTGHGNDAALRGGGLRVRGRFRDGVRLSGGADLVVQEVSPLLRPPTSLTVAARVKIDAATRGPGWVAAQGDNYGLVVNRYHPGDVCFYFFDGKDWPDVTSDDVDILDGRWHHLAGVLDRAARRMYVYKDGLRVAALPTMGAVRYKHGIGFTIGSMQGGRFFHGTIDDVRVYDHALSQQEMERIAMMNRKQQRGDLPPAEGTHRPTGVDFHRDTIRRLDGYGDNWCITWTADDSQVTSMCDGSWLDPRVGYHTHLYRLLGGPSDFRREDVPSYPVYSNEEGSWFGYGLVSVDGALYTTVSKTPGPGWSGPFRGIKLLKSPDNGRTWFRVDRNARERRYAGPDDPARNLVTPEEMFSLEEFGLPHQKQVAFPFSYLDFVQCGKDNAAAKDGYLYLYSPEGAHAHKLLLARVPKDNLGVRDAWEYFLNYDGKNAVWTCDLRKRGYAHVFPAASREGNCFGWYSWLPSVVWNEGLGLYIMVNGGTYAGHGMTAADNDYFDAWMHERPGSLGFWYAENPWGPWHEFFYTDYWTADDPGNLTYQPKLSPKWISADGTQMTLIWSDAMKNEHGKSHSVNYRWNQMTITLRMKNDAKSHEGPNGQ